MSPVQAVQSVFSKYIDCSGRAMRSEFWYWVLFVLVLTMVASAIDQAIGRGMLASTLWQLATLIPFLAVTVRRFHDTGRSAWYLLLQVPLGVLQAASVVTTSSAVLGVLAIPTLAGFAGTLFFLVRRGDEGTNRYGPPPVAP